MWAKLGGAGLGAVLAVALVGCAGSSESSVDRPVYDTVGDLAQEADLVVAGVVGRTRGTEVDDGGNDDGRGVPLEFFDFSVTDVLAGRVSTSPIAVAWLDLSKDDDGRSALEPGQELILFLDHRTPESAPGVESERDFYVVLGADNGVFDVRGDRVEACSDLVTSLAGAESDESRGQPLSVDAAAFRSAVAAAS